MKLLTENILVRYWKYLCTWRKHRQTIKQLNKLSDRQLADMSISRGDLDDLIFLEEDRKLRGSNGSVL